MRRETKHSVFSLHALSGLQSIVFSRIASFYCAQIKPYQRRSVVMSISCSTKIDLL